jgi:hypothetical protein
MLSTCLNSLTMLTTRLGPTRRDRTQKYDDYSKKTRETRGDLATLLTRIVERQGASKGAMSRSEKVNVYISLSDGSNIHATALVRHFHNSNYRIKRK